MKNLFVLIIVSTSLAGLSQTIGLDLGRYNVGTTLLVDNELESVIEGSISYSLGIMVESKSYNNFSFRTGLGARSIIGHLLVNSDGNWMSPNGDSSYEPVNFSQNYLVVPLSVRYNPLWTLNIALGINNSFLIKSSPLLDSDEFWIPEWVLRSDITVFNYFELGISYNAYFNKSYATKSGYTDVPDEEVTFKQENVLQLHFVLKTDVFKKKNDAEPISEPSY